MKCRQNPTKYFAFSLGIFVFLAASLVSADPQNSENSGDWRIYGDTTLHGEAYGSRGSSNQSPYASLGNQYYQELSLSGESQASPYDKWRFEFNGLWNNSLYRSQNWGGEIERLRLLREKGDTHVPYRLELGDLYANFSYRTLQRSLRGAQIEFQPKSSENNAQSFVLVYGKSSPDWRSVELAEDRTTALSWLFQEQEKKKFAVNFAHNQRDADIKTGMLERAQNVWSLAFERNATLFGKEAVFEAETAWFAGDHDGINGPTSGLDKQARSLYGQLSGGDNPFQYRFRYERSNQDFRPTGSTVAPDRKSAEGYLTWNLAQGRSAVLRLQDFHDSWESLNPQTTRLVGLSLRGPLDERQTLQGGIDAYVEKAENGYGTTDVRTRSLSADLAKSFSEKLSGRFGLSYRALDDQLNDTSDNRVAQATIGIDHSIRMAEINGNMSVDFENRLIDSGGDKSHEWTPALGLSFSHNEHDLGLHWRLQRQNYASLARIDVDTADSGLRYQYHRGPHTLGLEYLEDHREDSTGVWTRSYQLVGFYTYAFDTVLRSHTQKAVSEIAKATLPDLSQDLFASLPLNASYSEALDILTGRFGTPQRWGNMDIFDTVVFDEVAQRQRLATIHTGNRLARAALVINVDSSSAGTVMDVFDRVKRRMIDKYGTPGDVYERGMATTSLAADVREGTFIRNYEWDLGGRYLRLALPRRLDGRLTVEVVTADSFPPIQENTWGLERIN